MLTAQSRSALRCNDSIGASVNRLHSTGSFVGLMKCFCEHVSELTGFMLGLAEKVSNLQVTLFQIISVGTVSKIDQ
jgi:hypothetical protein